MLRKISLTYSERIKHQKKDFSWTLALTQIAFISSNSYNNFAVCTLAQRKSLFGWCNVFNTGLMYDNDNAIAQFLSAIGAGRFIGAASKLVGVTVLILFLRFTLGQCFFKAVVCGSGIIMAEFTPEQWCLSVC